MLKKPSWGMMVVVKGVIKANNLLIIIYFLLILIKKNKHKSFLKDRIEINEAFLKKREKQNTV